MKNNKVVRKWQKQLLWFLGILLCTVISVCQAKDDFKIDTKALIHETQKEAQSDDKLAMIWWMPEEFWQASFTKNQKVSAAQTEAMLKPLRLYTILVAVDGEIGPMGGVTYKPQDIIRNSLQVIDSEGVHYSPLSDDKINPDVKNFLGIMKPLLANMLGTMGQNMNFFVFGTTDQNGKNVVQAKESGTFTVMLDKQEFKWRLPLGSVMPPKVCPEDGEKLNGAWKYCPWHGVELK